MAGPGAAGYIGLTRVESSLEKWRAIERWLTWVGFAITDIVRGFSVYEDWPYLRECEVYLSAPHPPGDPNAPWYRSALIRVEAARELREVYPRRVRGRIYYDEETVATSIQLKR